MEARAVRKYIRHSPRKMRRVVNLVRDKTVPEAINILRFMPQKATEPTQTTIQSAVYNLMDKFEERFDEGELIIKEIRVDQGPMFKRWQPRARGRAAPIRKRTSHLTVVIAVREAEEEFEEV